MIPILSVFENSPDRGRGLARDMPVRWALEEVGQAYEVGLVSFGALKQSPYLARQPFGQIPAYEDGDLVLFESGAIVLHLAERPSGLLPNEPNARSRAISWMFAALSTIEPPIVELSMARLFDADRPWSADRLPLLEERVRDRLGRLSSRLGGADWLDGGFTAGDLMTISVMRRLAGSDVLNEFPSLVAYIERGEARPAFKRAFAAQLAVFRNSLAR